MRPLGEEFEWLRPAYRAHRYGVFPLLFSVLRDVGTAAASPRIFTRGQLEDRREELGDGERGERVR